MRLQLPALTSLLALASASTTLIFTIPSTPHLPNPYTLPPSTHSTLSTLSTSSTTTPSFLKAPLSTENTLTFHNITAGTYLLDTHSTTHFFAPLRVDVDESGETRAWETFRGNDWDNRGEAVPRVEVQTLAAGRVHAFQLKVGTGKGYFTERPSCAYCPLGKGNGC